MKPFEHIGEMIEYVGHHYDNPKALNIKTEFGWTHISTKAFIYDVKRLAYGLISMGLRKGDPVGILANSSPYWTIADLAIILAGGISVPLFSNISDENFVYQVAQSNVRFLFIAGVDQWEMYDRHRNLFQTVIGFDEVVQDSGAVSYVDALRIGEELWAKEPQLYEKLIQQMDSDDVITIIYTSGALGVPKGAMLTHRNLMHLVVQEDFSWDNRVDRYLSLLPLAHVFARQINFIMIGRGICIYHLNELPAIPSTCKEIKPSAMIVVPRLLEKMYGNMVSGLNRKGYLQRKIGKWAFDLAFNPSRSFCKRCFLHPIADFLVYSKLRKILGGNFRVILCGGAALDPALNRFFIEIGYPVYEGWGMTECSTVCVNRPGKVKIGTVGAVLGDSRIKLGEQGEILVKGSTVMKGYFRNEQATEEAFDEEGWFHTGDKGEIDDEGYLKLVGRVKDLFKLSNGEYVVPTPMEQTLQTLPLIDMAMVIGEKRKYAAVLLFPDFEVLKALKVQYDQTYLSDEEFLRTSYIQNEMKQILEKVNRSVNEWARIEQYQFIPHRPSVDEGELTPTMKLRRKNVIEKYNHLIELMYPEEAS